MLNDDKLILIFDSNLSILLLKDAIKYSEDFILDDNDIIDGIIFNITKIESLISKFIQKHNVSNLPALIILKDNLITQSMNQNLNLDPKIYHLKSYELQICPNLISYNLAIKHYQMFQYSLLCAKLSIRLEAITTSLLHLHKLFKECLSKKIDSSIKSIESLRLFFKHAIEESKLQHSICNTAKYFDTISKHINY